MLLVGVLLGTCPAAAERKPKVAEASATIAGTVFRTPGFALPGAEVTITPEAAEREGRKFKKETVVSSSRGEWAVRVPAVPMSYVVNVEMKGYESQHKTVAVEGEQRREVNFMLDPSAASGGTR